MPIRRVKGGFKWGRHGKVYPTRAGAERQAQAAYASGYREPEDEDTSGCEFPTVCYGAPFPEAEGFRVSSAAFADGATLPIEYTADGENISPPLSWNVPEGTREIAIIMDDPDAPGEVPWVHWVAYGLKGSGVEAGARSSGENSWGSSGYRGPDPPPGPAHRYRFKVYALNTKLGLEAGATEIDLLRAMHGHIIDQGELIGIYGREKETMETTVDQIIRESLPLCRELLDRRAALIVEAGLRTRVDVKIDGWQGKQTIPPEQLQAFASDLKAIPSVGFLPAQGQLVQLDKKHLPQLDGILRKHGLRIGVAPKQATQAITDIGPLSGRIRHRVPPQLRR